jgi:hypothetical protein
MNYLSENEWKGKSAAPCAYFFALIAKRTANLQKGFHQNPFVPKNAP